MLFFFIFPQALCSYYHWIRFEKKRAVRLCFKRLLVNDNAKVVPKRLEWNVPAGQSPIFCMILIALWNRKQPLIYYHFRTTNQVYGQAISVVKIFPVFFVGNNQICRCKNNLKISAWTSNMYIESVKHEKKVKVEHKLNDFYNDFTNKIASFWRKCHWVLLIF